MTSFPMACQTITWGEEQSRHFPEVFDRVKAAGYAGVEIGFRHMRQVSAPDVKDLLDERGLVFAALHIGGNLFDAVQADQERSALALALDIMRTVDTRLLMYSGLRYRDGEQFAADLGVLNRAAEKCRDAGVRLLYHNHNWEFADDARVMRALWNESSEALGFCPDIGWVMKGGMDTIECLEAMRGRIGAVHFKDFATDGNEVDTVVLGEGVAPLREAAEWITANTSGMWVIAEQDNADIPAGQAAAKNAEFLNRVFRRD